VEYIPLFSLGDSSLTTKVHCGNGKCLIRYEINDAFIHALDIHDKYQEYYKYWGFDIATPYKINFKYNVLWDFR
jgi:hypothetical protein